MVVSIAAVFIHVPRSKRVAGIGPSLSPMLCAIGAERPRQTEASSSERYEKAALLANSFASEPAMAARPYRDKQTIGYSSVYNGTDTNLRCG